jgi:16S rRNA (adenine1518-N6/adenine1519-N6)-dimethyltransferase
MQSNSEINKFLQDNNFNPSKKMGQNFLFNNETIENIVSNVDFENVDLVIEIGPGLSALTEHLVKKSKKLIAIELDKRLYEHNVKKFKSAPNFSIINNDVLQLNFDDLTKGFENVIIVSNLPYSISSLCLIKFIQCDSIKTMYCMLQKEMVERIIAVPSTKQYNAFTVVLNTYSTITKLMDVYKEDFIPAPEVDSVVIKLEKNGIKYDDQFNKFIKLCFGSKRRTLQNNLSNMIDKQKLVNILNELNIRIDVRAEALTIGELFNIYNKIG